MTFRRLSTTALEAVKGVLSTRAGRAVLTRLGLQSRAATLYWWLQYAVSDGTEIRTVSDATATFLVDGPKELRHYRTLVGEEGVFEDLLERLEPGDVFYDVGPFLGTYTCLIGRSEEVQRVVAFEPDHGRRRRTEQNAAENCVDADVYPYALDESNGIAQFVTGTDGDEPIVSHLAPDSQASTIDGQEPLIDGQESLIDGQEPLIDSQESTIDGRRPTTDEQKSTISVQTRSGDDLVGRGEIPRPNVVKIDVEGSELGVIRGLSQTLAEECRLVYCEVHSTLLPNYGASDANVEEALSGLGFEVERIDERGTEYFLRGSKPP